MLTEKCKGRSNDASKGRPPERQRHGIAPRQSASVSAAFRKADELRDLSLLAGRESRRFMRESRKLRKAAARAYAADCSLARRDRAATAAELATSAGPPVADYLGIGGPITADSFA